MVGFRCGFEEIGRVVFQCIHPRLQIGDVVLVELALNVRIGLGTWQAKNRKVQFGAQCPVCATLSKQPWVMQNIKSWRTYEDMNEPEGEDYLQVIRDISPERIYD